MNGRLTWAELQAVIADADAPRALRFDGEPVVHLVFDPARAELGLRLPRGQGDTPVSPLALLRISQRVVHDGAIIEISTSSPALFPYFHGFATAVADRVQIDGLDSHAAIEECLFRWRDLFREAAKLTAEEQLGLLGELWLLQRLVRRHGADVALAAWTGPAGQAHDFRLGDMEIEVKSTTNEHRVHIISSDTQLTASVGASLFVLSLQYTSAGADPAHSLAGSVHTTRELLGDPAASARFDAILEQHFGVASSDLAIYTTPLKLRTPPCLVPVDEHFPRIDVRVLAASTEIARISDIRYRVNLEGLGHLAESPEFIEVLGEDA